MDLYFDPQTDRLDSLALVVEDVILQRALETMLVNLHRARNFVSSTVLHVGLGISCVLVALMACGFVDARPINASPSWQLSQFAIADFDGDSRPDLANVQVGQGSSGGTRYSIDFQLSTGFRQTVSVTAPTGGLRLTSRDVNGDSFLDVVVTTSWTGLPVAVFLNDGRGHFTQSDPVGFPQAFHTPENFWTSGSDGIKDATAELFSRYLPGDYAECRGRHSPQSIAARLAPGSFGGAAVGSSESFLGRAPPSPPIHL